MTYIVPCETRKVLQNDSRSECRVVHTHTHVLRTIMTQRSSIAWFLKWFKLDWQRERQKILRFRRKSRYCCDKIPLDYVAPVTGHSSKSTNCQTIDNSQRSLFIFSTSVYSKKQPCDVINFCKLLFLPEKKPILQSATEQH